jgi:hypothetical protein
VSVNGTPVGSDHDFSTGANGSVTLDAAVSPGDQVTVTVTWSIEDKSGRGTNTEYDRVVQFTVSTSASFSVASLPNCTVTDSEDTCTTIVVFDAPSDEGSNYWLRIVAIDAGAEPANVHIEGTELQINFSVAEEQDLRIDTKLKVRRHCYLLNAGEVDLSATLKELESRAPIVGAEIALFINPELDEYGYPTATSFPVGSAITVTDENRAVATLSHDINGLGVGDYNLYAEFDGDLDYLPSNDSNTLGITYLFVGFGQPINPDETSIFGGRVIPIKIRLVDAKGAPVTDATPTVWLQKFVNDMNLGEEWEQTASVSAADTDNIMRYDPKDQQYIYNWDATGLANGTYAVKVDLGDSPTCRTENPYAIITVDRRGGGKK